jgi:photosystem II stability/assembly factor-like uncharacterized protein
MLTLTLVSCAGWALAEQASDAVSARDPEAESARHVQFFDLTFLDAQRGWVVGGAGAIMHTTDGGATWVRQRVTDGERLWGRKVIIPPNLLRVTFVTAQEGWVVGAEGTLLHTRDGSASWRVGPRPTTADLFDVRFVTSQIGLIVGDRGLILRTRDGGRTWRRQRSAVRHPLQDIACFSPDECIIGGGAESILTTSNGGRTWGQQELPEGPIHPWTGRIVRAGDGTLWMGGGYHNYGALLRSTDRGKQWTVATDTLLSAPTALFFWNANRGVIFSGRILLTADGGATWTEGQSPVPGVLLQAIAFIDDRLGWAVGAFKTILHTRDGGNTWVIQYTELRGPRP